MERLFAFKKPASCNRSLSWWCWGALALYYLSVYHSNMLVCMKTY